MKMVRKPTPGSVKKLMAAMIAKQRQWVRRGICRLGMDSVMQNLHKQLVSDFVEIDLEAELQGICFYDMYAQYFQAEAEGYELSESARKEYLEAIRRSCNDAVRLMLIVNLHRQYAEKAAPISEQQAMALLKIADEFSCREERMIDRLHRAGFPASDLVKYVRG